MTRDRRFKKRVRARIARTGESYTVAYQVLRQQTSEDKSMTQQKTQTINNHDFGYTIEVPSTWRDLGPDIYNSAFEVARYLRNAPIIHDGIVNIFWGLPAESRQSAANSGDPDVFDLNKDCLEKEGIAATVTEVMLGGRPATRLDHAYRFGDIAHWASRSYFMEVRGAVICLNMGTSDVLKDSPVFDWIAESFRPIENATGIILIHDGKTPAAVVSQLLVDHFDYMPRKATQRLVKMTTQKESVVALVESDQALQLVESINKNSLEKGYSLSCRIAN
ncbi:MAG: ATP-dependent Clp protease adapter protein ClpS [Sulfitobacter sp.]|jgi:ATP-dependent Clp protease adapter protein ClpS